MEKLDEKTVNQRIMEFLKFMKISVNSMCKELNLKQSTVNGQLNGTNTLSADTIVHVIRAYPELSAEWVLRGKGPMILNELSIDPELQAICMKQTRIIHRLEQRIAELEGEKKELA